MSVFQPFAFKQGPSAPTPPAGWDPTFGGTIIPDYWWDLQDNSTKTLSGNDVLAMSSKGSQTDGDLTSTTNNGVYPQNLSDGVRFTATQRLGSPLTLIPHQTDCTVFLAFIPQYGGGSTQVVFGHEGYTYSGNFAVLQTVGISKSISTTQDWWFNGVRYPYGTGYVTTPRSLDTTTRPVSQNATNLWLRAGNENFTSMMSNMTTLMATREWTGVDDNVIVENAINQATMTNNFTTNFPTSTLPDEGTAIGQAGRPSLGRDPFYGDILQVVVYLQKLTQPQLTQLYDGWIADAP